MRSRLLRAMFLMLLVALSVACTKTLNTDQLESTLKTRIQQQLNAKDLTVHCPDSEPIKAGATFTCTAVDPSGQSATITVTQKDDQGNVTWKITGVQSPSASP